MAAKKPTFLSIVLKNFRSALRPAPVEHEVNPTGYQGSDQYGNQYFERVSTDADGNVKRRRHFVPADGEDFEVQKPPEWEAWLRKRRLDPPTPEEIAKNLAIMYQKQRNAALIEQKEKEKFPEFAAKLEDSRRKSKLSHLDGGHHNFPVYDDFEVDPLMKKKLTAGGQTTEKTEESK